MVINEQERDLRVSLFLTPDLGSVTWHRLIDFFGSAEAVYRASRLDLLQCVRLQTSVVEQVLQGPNLQGVEKQKQLCEQYEVCCTLVGESEYPSHLQSIDMPPPVLFWHTKKSIHSFTLGDSLAIVGTRHPSPYGREVADYFSQEVAQQGIVVVSGMALGVDQVAHSGALEVSRKTIGVLGGGIDQFNIEGSKLHTRMWEEALLVSEFPMETAPSRSTFPIRNRTISGLSQGTLIVEAGEKSGALITAKAAQKQEKPVFVTPGSLLHSNNKGGHNLLQSHGKLALSPQEIIHALRGTSAPFEPNRDLEERTLPFSQQTSFLELSALQSKVVEALCMARSPFEVAQSCKEPLANIYSTLIELEQMCVVSRQPGDKYVRR